MAMNMMQSILDKTGLGGFRTGISDRDQLMHSNVDLDTKGIANLRSQNNYENELLDNPLKAVERAQKIAAGESDTADILSGGRDRDRERKREMEIADLLTKQDENKRRQIEDAAQAAIRAASVFKPDDTPLLQAQKWPEAVRIARENGLTNIPDKYTPDNFQKLQTRAQAAPMTIKHIQSMQTADQKFKHDTQLADQKHGQTLEVHDIDNEAAMERQRLQSKTTMEATRLRESGEWSRHNANPVLSRSKEVVAAKNRVDAAIEGRGEASLNDFAMVAKDLYGAELGRAATLLAPTLQAETQQLRMDIATAKTPEEKKAKEKQLRNLARDAQKEMESMAFPPEFAAKYDEIRRKKYGSIENAPVPEPIAKALTTPPTEAAPASGAKNFDEWKAKDTAEKERVDKIKASSEYLALQSEYNTALANRNQTEARAIKAEMDKLLGVAPKPAAAPAAKSGRTIVNRGVRKSDGKTVVMYSDGTTEVQ